MNHSALTGFFLAIFVFVTTSLQSFHDPGVLVDYKSALMVLGGTIAATLITIPIDKIKELTACFKKFIIKKKKDDPEKLIQEIVFLAEARRIGGRQFEDAIEQVANSFLKNAAEVVLWLKSDVTTEELRKILETRAESHAREYTSAGAKFRSIAKYPPAFGLMGTTLGMIALLQSLGTGEDAKKMIGPAMAIALVTTLYGLALANFLLLPIAENLMKQSQDEHSSRMMVVEGIMLIQSSKPPKFVEAQVRSFVAPSHISSHSSKSS